jgi:hypothetical protein
MGKRILHRPGLFGLRPEEQPFPILVCKVCDQMIQELKLLDRALNDFLAVVTHGKRNLQAVQSSYKASFLPAFYPVIYFADKLASLAVVSLQGAGASRD